MSQEVENDMAMLRRAAEQLAEHFDTVQILVSRHDPAVHDGTLRAHFGLGNSCARYGQAREWLLWCEAQQAARAARMSEGQ